MLYPSSGAVLVIVILFIGDDKIFRLPTVLPAPKRELISLYN